MNDPESLQLLLSLIRDGEYPAAESLEAAKLNSHLLNQFNAFNVTFHAYQTGVIGEPEWDRYSRRLCDTLNVLPTEVRITQLGQLNESFIAYIESAC